MIRNEMLAELKAYAPELRTKASAQISQKLVHRLEPLIASGFQKIAAFAPLNDEPDLTSFYMVLLEKYKNRLQWHFPVMEPEYALVPVETRGKTTLSEMIEKWPKSPLGFRIPPPARAAHSLEVIMLPGVVFGPQGQRIGRGKGYYDRILARYPHALTLALAFDFQIRVEMHTDSSTEQAWDRRVDWIVTESREICTEGFFKKTALLLK